jgi:type IV pilus assembly protein PilB
MTLAYGSPTRRFGELLVARGKIDLDALDRALNGRHDPRERIGQALVRLSLLEESEIAPLLAEQFTLPIADADRLAKADLAAVGLVPEHLARQAGVLALKRTGQVLEVAVCDPLDVVSLDHVRALTGCTLKVYVARSSEVVEAIEEFYQEIRSTESLGAILDRIDLTGPAEQVQDLDLATLRQRVEDAPVVRLVNLMLAEAIDAHASDIHVEPMRDRISVRFRIDGMLHEVMKPPKNLQMVLISRLKVLANLDIATTLLPQDGRITVHLPDREVDVRVSTLPTAFGEKVVLRLFDKKAFTHEVARLGLEGAALESFQRAIHQPHGMILISGPTGSGKSTTLYSALNEIKSVHRNLLTVEDPIEYNIDGVIQVHANAKVGMTFARALRAILRQDPDVIMVGEIRDGETADIAVKSALTGHLVLSTVHANDGPGTVTRLVDMGVQRFLVGSAVTLVMAQRLVRRTCERCRVTFVPDADQLESLGTEAAPLRDQTLVRGRGCLTCKHTGYSGRIALFEVLELSRTIRRMVLDGLSEDEIKRQAVAEGLVTLRRNGIQKILQGLTTIDEVRIATLAEGD